MATTTRLYTVEELERNPPGDMLDWELIDGELIEVPAAGDRGSSRAVTISALLWVHVQPRRLGRIYGADGGFVLFPGRQTMRAPDDSFVRADHVPIGEDRDRFPRLAPDLAVEVVSPND